MDAVRPLLLRQLDGPIEGYFSQFQEITLRPEGNTKPKQRRIAREIAAMGEPDGLPLAPGSAIFVRVDGERPDKMRCMVVGPEGTPYSAGAFVFDVLFPEKYPQEARAHTHSRKGPAAADNTCVVALLRFPAAFSR